MTTVEHSTDYQRFRRQAEAVADDAEQQTRLAAELVFDIYYEPLEERESYIALIDNTRKIRDTVKRMVLTVAKNAALANRADEKAPHDTPPFVGFPDLRKRMHAAFTRCDDLVAAAEEFRPNK